MNKLHIALASVFVLCLSWVACASPWSTGELLTAVKLNQVTPHYSLEKQFGNLSSAKVAIGMSKATLQYSTDQVVNTLTIPSNIEIVPINGASITVNSGKTLTYLGSTERWPKSQVVNANGTLILSNGSTIYPQWYGAKADGVTNDNAAFASASNTINAMGGGVTLRVAGSYIVGHENFIPGTGYDPNGTVGWFQTIYVANCTKPVVLQFDGAVMKRANGMHFGMFDPTTGLAAPANTGSAAQNGIMIDLAYNTSVVVKGNLELNGNNPNMVIGGQYGDTGWQLASYGIRAYNNKELNIENVYSHHQGTDDFIIGYRGATAEMPDVHTTLTNCRGEYSGRQGLSWVGGSNLTAINCKFNHTGRAALASNPASGVDIEGEDTIRHGVFINCEFVDNAGDGMVTDTGTNATNVAFYNCKFIGTTNYALWSNGARFRYYNCTIVGGITHLYYADAETATRFIDCTITDDVTKSYNSQVYIGASSYLMDFGGTSSVNTLFDRCNFVMTQSRLTTGFSGTISNSTIDIRTGTNIITSGNLWVSNGAIFNSVTVIDNITTYIPGSSFTVPTGMSMTGINRISGSGHIIWQGMSSGIVGGTVSPRINAGKPVSIMSGTAAPADGQDWAENTIVINSNPTELGSAGSKYMVSQWYCVSPTAHVCNSSGAGTGTWYALRMLTGN